jgi:outer membrane lipoprotein-sorting protein
LTAVAAVAAAAALGSVRASAEPALPVLAPSALLVKAQQVRVGSFSGEVRSTAKLGLPALPAAAGVDWTSLAAGTQTLRVYVDGPGRQRVDLLGPLAQVSVVRSDRDLWTWSSSTRRVTHASVPGTGGWGDAGPGRPPLASGQQPATPQQIADRVLAAITPTTSVSVGRAASVAGRSAYQLELRPRDRATLVGSVKVYVDSRTGMALRTVITPRGSREPAVDIGFTALTLAAPSPSIFAFRPPTGASVTELPTASDRQSGPDASDPPQVLGAGWTAVVTATAPKDTGAVTGPDAPAGEPAALVDGLRNAAKPVAGRFGTGRLLSTRLLTVLMTDDGRTFAGAVTPAELLRQANLAGPRR